MRLLIAGSRTFNNYEALEAAADYILKHIKAKDDYEQIIVSGTARGTDRLGEKYAKSNGLQIAHFPADWEGYGKRAGFIRNEQMAEFSDFALIFWDGKSNGTRHMINTAVLHQVPVFLIPFFEPEETNEE